MSFAKTDWPVSQRVRAFLRDSCAVETPRALGMREAAKLRVGEVNASNDSYEVVSPAFAFQHGGPAVGLTDRVSACCEETKCVTGTVCVIAVKP